MHRHTRIHMRVCLPSSTLQFELCCRVFPGGGRSKKNCTVCMLCVERLHPPPSLTNALPILNLEQDRRRDTISTLSEDYKQSSLIDKFIEALVAEKRAKLEQKFSKEMDRFISVKKKELDEIAKNIENEKGTIQFHWGGGDRGTSTDFSYLLQTRMHQNCAAVPN